jgi:hypothetical protein
MDKIAKLINENLRNIIAEIENLLAQKNYDWQKIHQLDIKWQKTLKINLAAKQNQAAIAANSDYFHSLLTTLHTKHLQLMQLAETERLSLRDTVLSKNQNRKNINKYLENSR